MKAHKIIFFNQKGGVGKTTTCVNLGAALGAMGYKVLLVDFDSQANLTGAVSGDGRKSTIYQVISGQKTAADAIQKTIFENISLIAGSVDTAGLTVELVDEPEREFYLKHALRDLDDMFDYILLDCPPSIGLETMNALAWANVKKSLNPELNIMGILFTLYSKRVLLNQDVVDDVSEYFKELVFKTIIPRSVRLSEAPSHGMPINVYDKNNVGAKAYASLAKEVVDRAW